MIEIKSYSISPADLADLLSDGKGHEVLDVRTPSEYASAHVPGTRLIPLNELKVEAYLAQHKPGKPIYVICQAGMRAAKAIEQFQRAGCEDSVLVEGGAQAWIDAGLPVHHGARATLPLMRQVQIVAGAFSAVGAVLVLAVNPWFAVLPLLIGCGFIFAGVTGTCGLALLLARMPWNRGQANSCHCCPSE